MAHDGAYFVAVSIVLAAAYLRTVLVLLATVRTVLDRNRFAAFRVGWVELACALEPPLFFVFAWSLHGRLRPAAGVTAAATVAALVGAALVVLAWALYAWTFASWPTLFVGHGVLADHALVDRGAYGFVRHPAYLAAFLVWLGLAVGFRSWAALGVTIAYVIPVYLLYIRSEEAMLAEFFGDRYARYRRTVPMLIPGRPMKPLVDVFTERALWRLVSLGLTPSRWPGTACGTVILEVTGRRSRNVRSLLVTWVEYGRERYLVSMPGLEPQWVKNMRAAAGEVVLRHGRRRTRVHLRELPVHERAAILRAWYAVTRLSSPPRANFKLGRDAAIEEFERIAGVHPVYRIVGASITPTRAADG
jgi:deazaflavin-dependent oxidoreductase (nitroreductase family)